MKLESLNAVQQSQLLMLLQNNQKLRILQCDLNRTADTIYEILEFRIFAPLQLLQKIKINKKQAFGIRCWKHMILVGARGLVLLDV